MRLSEPRIAPLPPSEWDADSAERMKKAMGNNPPNILKTLVNHPKLYKRWAVFGNHILAQNSMPPREREIAMLRIGWLCNSEYEFGQHTVIGRDCGLTDDEILRITKGADAGWEGFDKVLIAAVDELHEDAFVGDATWAALNEHYDQNQVMDFVFTVGQYTLVSMVLNTFGVQLDDGVPGYPEGAG